MPRSEPSDPLLIEGGYAHVHALALAGLWAGYRAGYLKLADARAWLALRAAEAGLQGVT